MCVVEDTSVPKRPSVEPKSELGYFLRSKCVRVGSIIGIICDYGFDEGHHPICSLWYSLSQSNSITAPSTNYMSIPQIFIPILTEMFMSFLFGFPSFLWFLPSLISRFHPASCGSSFKETWAIPYFSKWHITSWWSWSELHRCLIRYPFRSSNKFLYYCKYLYYPLRLKWNASQTDFNLRI